MLLEPGEVMRGYRVPTSAFLYVIRGSAELYIDGSESRMPRFHVLHVGKGIVLDISAEEQLEYFMVLYKATLPLPRRYELVNQMPNLELIASLKPDLIIGNKVRQEKIYDQLKQIAPTVFAADLVGDWKINFKLYSEAVNKKDEGEKAMAAFDKRVAEVKAKLGSKEAAKVSLMRMSAAQVRIYQKQTFAGVLLSQLGVALAGRMLFMPLDIPAGVFTAGIGAPFFLYLLFKRKPIH